MCIMLYIGHTNLWSLQYRTLAKGILGPWDPSHCERNVLQPICYTQIRDQTLDLNNEDIINLEMSIDEAIRFMSTNYNQGLGVFKVASEQGQIHTEYDKQDFGV